MIQMNEAILTHNSGGIVNKAALCGSANPELYMKRWQKQFHRGGGYQMQMSPNDIALLVNHARPYLKNKRMLCIGVETFGAERFIAEELGMIEVDIWNPESSPKLSENMKQVAGSKMVSEPSSQYDLITLFGEGDFNLEGILRFGRVNGLVCCLNTNKLANMPALRQVWMDLRRLHFPLLQTVEAADMGIGMARITYLEEKINGNTKPLYTKRADGAIRESGSQSKTEQSPAPEDNQGNQSGGIRNSTEGDNPGRTEIQEVGGASGSAPIQEWRPEDSQAEEVLAPWGRKKDGSPKGRPGRPVVV